MANSASVEFDIRKRLPASLEAVDPVSMQLRRLMEGRYSRTDVFAGELLCREALANAIRHGSEMDGTRTVNFAARVRSNRLTMAVTDEGPGFDWRSVKIHAPGDCDVCGRGMAIYQGYADRIRFNRSGNQVMLVRRLGIRGKQV